MAMIAVFIFLIVLPAVIAFVLASVLPNLFPTASYRARTLSSAAGAGCLPMALPAAVLLFGAGANYGYSPLIPLAGVLFIALLMALVIGLPVAIWARRGKEAPRDNAATFD